MKTIIIHLDSKELIAQGRLQEAKRYAFSNLRKKLDVDIEPTRILFVDSVSGEDVK